MNIALLMTLYRLNRIGKFSLHFLSIYMPTQTNVKLFLMCNVNIK